MSKTQSVMSAEKQETVVKYVTSGQGAILALLAKDGLTAENSEFVRVLIAMAHGPHRG